MWLQCPDVTDTGLGYLCKDDGTYGKCKQLEMVNILSVSKELTEHGFVTLLENLPELKSTTSGDIKVNKAITLFAERNKGKTLNLNFISGLQYKSQDELTKLLKIVPKNECVFIDQDVPLDFKIFKQYDISDYTIDFRQSYAFNVNDFFQSMGEKITKLTLKVLPETGTDVDVEILAKQCPNLEEMSLTLVNTWASNIFIDFRGTFSKLKSFEIMDSGRHPFPASALLAIMCSKNLKYLCTCEAVHLTDNFVDLLVDLAQNDYPHIFQNLKKLHVTNYFTQCNFSKQAFMKLVCLTPKLEDFSCATTEEGRTATLDGHHLVKPEHQEDPQVVDFVTQLQDTSGSGTFVF